MLKIPYIKQPDDSSCALACYYMVAKHFFPQVTFDEIAKISDWKPGYVVWAFKFWLWIMDKGIKITEYDTTGYEVWAEEGLEGLRKSTSEKEFKYYVEHSFDLESYSHDIKKMLKHRSFIFHREKPTFELLESTVKSGKVCEVVLDSRTLKRREGFALHRVVILDINNDLVTLHDPADKPNVKVNRSLFIKSWLEAVSESELCIYENNSQHPDHSKHSTTP